VIGGLNTFHPLAALKVAEDLNGQILKGQHVYFQNMPNYRVKHLMANAQGYMTLCCDATPTQEKFVTLGLASGGLDRNGVMEKLRAEYNETPMGMEIVTEQVAKKVMASYDAETLEISEVVKDFKVSREQFDEIIQMVGGEIIQIIDWRVDRVQQLVRATQNQGQKLLQQWNAPIKKAALEGQQNGQ
jgi:hypothetical protein